jgi:hypothetical protein
MNLTRLNTLLLVGAIVLFIWGLFLRPQRRFSGRFQALPTPEGPDVALDTATGRLCYTYKVSNAAPDIPTCSELR